MSGTLCGNRVWAVSVDPEQLYVEDECGTAGDAGLRTASVGLFGRDVNLPAVADVHLLECDDPSGDEVAQPEGRSYSATATVKCLAVDGLACVVCSDHAGAVGRGGRSVALADDFVEDALVELVDTRFGGFLGQILAIAQYVVLLCHDSQWMLEVASVEELLHVVDHLLDALFL